MRYEDATLRKLQLFTVEMMREIDAVCKKHGIEYFVDSGTALGAVRHAGFIPWDDDVDLGMMRPDYDRFCEVAPRELGELYTVSNARNNPKQSAFFTKVWRNDTKFYTDETLRAGIKQGIGIDVFPYDALSADPSVAKSQVAECMNAQRMMYLYHSAHVVVPHKGALGAAERAACRAAHALLSAASSHDKIRERFERAERAGWEKPGGDYMVFAYAQFGPYPKEVLLPTREVSFEGFSFPAPGQTERYLEILYGDWKTLPPEGERRNHAPVELDFGGWEPK